MRFATPITVALVVLTAFAAPIAAERTTTECEPKTTATMNESMGETTEMMGDETTTGMMSETTTCMADDSMAGTTSAMADDSMADTTDATESGSSAFAPGFGVGAAVVALVAALYVARRRP
ncbi:PGF-CTERM sorting domain-containing protein [Halorussus caseinilyticus]|uniref:PGF-CTERM sorting domain-containing protein n=1 Tax=Halorussus caseinilyticus TaxID=3034025 RepID=A0ABD5WQ07_9EURY|nr:PGF-CTERM sorting domain-containing protein [Halorussus sp. DT72]